MTVVALASVKHAPGVTTSAVVLAAAWESDAIVVEADPSGGDLVARTRLPPEPGLLTLAASARHPDTRLEVGSHAQPLPGGGFVVVAPTPPELAAGAVGTIAGRLPGSFAGRHGIIDCGRLSPESPSWPAALGADILVLLAEPTLAAVEHLRVHLASADGAVGPPRAVLLVGDRPYGDGSVETALGVPVLGVMAVDPRGVAAVHERRVRRSLVVRSARAAIASMGELLDGRLRVP